MANPMPRVIFACAIPTIIVILSYIWFKRKKDLGTKNRQEHRIQKSPFPKVDPNEGKELAKKDNLLHAHFQKIPEDSKLPFEMVTETASDKDGPCQEKGGEEFSVYEASNSLVSSCNPFPEIMQETPLLKHYGQIKGSLEIPMANGSELKDVAPHIANMTLQSSCEVGESETGGLQKSLLQETCPMDRAQSDENDTCYMGTNIEEPEILECSKNSAPSINESNPDLKLATVEGFQKFKSDVKEDLEVLMPAPSEGSYCSLDVEGLKDTSYTSSEELQCSLHAVAEPDIKHFPLEDSQCSLDVVGSPDTKNASLEDLQCYLDVTGSPGVQHASMEDSQCYLDVTGSPGVQHATLEDSQCYLDVDSPNVTHASLEDLQCSLEVVDLTGAKNTLSEGSQASPCKGHNLSEGEKLTSKGSQWFTAAMTSHTKDNLETSFLEGSTCSSDAEFKPLENHSDARLNPLKDSPDLVSIREDSMDTVSTPPNGSPSMMSTPVTFAKCTQDMKPTPPEGTATQISDSDGFNHLVSLPSSLDAEPIIAEGSPASPEVEPTLDAEGQCEEASLNNCSSCTLTTTLMEEIEDIPDKDGHSVVCYSRDGDGDPGAGCEHASVLNFSSPSPIKCKLETEEARSIPNSGLPAEEAELQKLANGNSTSAYGSSSHSPADDLLESPTISNYDMHSEGSSDSGKGDSDIHTPNIEGASSNFPYTALQVYEFEIPQSLCGRLIGARGRFVNYIKRMARANICIKRHPYNPELKISAVIGTEEDINSALALIRKRFPIPKYSMINMLQVNAPLLNGIPIPDTLQLHLPEAVTSEVILSSLVTAGHFFVQQPLHPTYSSLSCLDLFMSQCYLDGTGAPELPAPVEAGIICAASTMGGWFRAQIVYVYPDSNECEVKFVDYGGYSKESISGLRQIRSDFMTLPFQASECFLANVSPVDESQGWSLEAISCFEELAQGQILQARIVSFSEDGIPYVHLYRVQGVTTTFINRELVSCGVARWVENEA